MSERNVNLQMKADFLRPSWELISTKNAKIISVMIYENSISVQEGVEALVVN